MRLPPMLKDFDVFAANQRFKGLATTYVRPKIALKTETWLAAGMLGEVKLAFGLEELESESKFGGDQPALNAEFGDPRIDGSLLRFVGAYQAEDDGDVTRVEITQRGRTVEIDRGDDEKGTKTEVSYKHSLVYYKEVVDGVVMFEIDMLESVFIVNGVDRWQQIRDAVN